jgi:hypothetical protein
MIEMAVGYEYLPRAGNLRRLHRLYRPGLRIARKIRINKEYPVANLNLEAGRAQPLEFHAVHLLPSVIIAILYVIFTATTGYAIL